MPSFSHAPTNVYTVPLMRRDWHINGSFCRRLSTLVNSGSAGTRRHGRHLSDVLGLLGRHHGLLHLTCSQFVQQIRATKLPHPRYCVVSIPAVITAFHITVSFCTAHVGQSRRNDGSMEGWTGTRYCCWYWHTATINETLDSSLYWDQGYWCCWISCCDFFFWTALSVWCGLL